MMNVNGAFGTLFLPGIEYRPIGIGVAGNKLLILRKRRSLMCRDILRS